MHQTSDRFDRWYLRLIAGLFALLCSVSSLRYLWMDITGDALIPLVVQVVCLLFAVCGLVYFVWPKLGHHTLLALSIGVFVTHAGAGQRSADMFWLCLIGLLLIPYFGHRYFATLPGRERPG